MLIESNGGFENVYVPQVAVARDSAASKAMSARNAISPTAMRGSRAGTPRRYADDRAQASGPAARGWADSFIPIGWCDRPRGRRGSEHGDRRVARRALSVRADDLSPGARGATGVPACGGDAPRGLGGSVRAARRAARGLVAADVGDRGVRGPVRPGDDDAGRLARRRRPR